MPVRVSQDDTFITLIQVAREDPEVGMNLKRILSLDGKRRKIFITSWLEDMKHQGAPADFMAAVSYLIDDDIAEKALALINEQV